MLIATEQNPEPSQNLRSDAGPSELGIVKAVAKRLCRAGATLAVLPAATGFWFGEAALGWNRTFPGWSQAFSLVPGLTGVYLRRAFYRFAMTGCAADACISFGTVFSHRTVSVGGKVYVGLFCSIGDATIEEDVLIGSHVSIMNGGTQHGIERLDVPVREQPGKWPHITIGCDTWIGDRAVIMSNVGRHAVVAAGAVVTKPVPDCAIVAGVPAKVVRYRT